VARPQLTPGFGKTAAAAALAALVSAATAAAAIAPTPGRYRGKTSQHRFASMRVAKGGHVHTVKLRWLAKCDEPGYVWGVDQTTWSDEVGGGIEQEGDHFSDGGTYTEEGAHGNSGRITANIKGHFTSASRAQGRFFIKVDARKNGKHVDWCRAKGRWHVSRKGGG
jgi:hypothetical protein